MKLNAGYILVAIGLAVLHAILYIFKPGPETIMPWVYDFGPAVCAVFAMTGLLSAIRAFGSGDSARISWGLMLAAVALFFMAETAYGVQELFLGVNMDEVFPTIADGFWVAGYLPFILGLTLFVRMYFKTGLPVGKPSSFIIGGTLLLALALGIMGVLLIPIMNDPELGGFARAVYLFYPAADLVLLAPAITLVLITRQFGVGSFSWPWRLMAAGICLLAFADIIFATLDWKGLYNTGNPIDLAWNCGYLFFGVAGFAQKDLIASV